MTSAAQTIRSLTENAMNKNPGLTRIMTALPRRHGGGGFERRAIASARAEGVADVSFITDLRDGHTKALPKALRELGINPKRANAAVISIRNGEKISIHLLVVEPGDVDQNQFTSFVGYTEAEYFKISNGPEPKRFPYLKMPNPIGHVIEVLEDGTFGDKNTTSTGAMTWVDAPIAWTLLPGVKEDIFVMHSIDANDPSLYRPGSLPGRDKEDLFINATAAAIGMSPPSIRDIRKQGTPNGFRDEVGNVVD